jgi:TP901 family phage tail tape measure protein
MAGSRTITTRLRAEMAQFKKEWDSAGKAVEEAAQRIERSNTPLGRVAASVDKNAAAWHTAGKTILAAGVLMSAAMIAPIKAAIEWEAAWTGVLKTTDGTPAQLARLEVGLRSLATQLPASAQEIAAVAESAGALGVKRKDLLSFTRTMVDLGETTNLTAEDAATGLQQLMNVMGTAPDQVDNLGSALVYLGNNGASTERQILDMAQNIAGAGKIVGLSEGDVLGLSNALASAGIEAEAGGSSVSAILIDISKAVATNSKDLSKWAEVSGMSVEEFSAKWKTSPAEGFAAFTEGLGKVNAAGGDVFTTLEQLGQTDVRVTRALLGMATSGDMLRKSLAGGNEEMQRNTALAAEADKRYGTTAAQVEIAKNKLTESMIGIGQDMLPAVNSVVGGLGDILDGFNALPSGAKTAIGTVGGLGAAFTTAGGLAVLAIPKMVQFSTAVGAMSNGPLKTAGTRMIGFGRFLMGPWGVALAAGAVGLGILAQRAGDAAQKQQELKASAAEFTSLLDQQTGAITDANREAVAMKLAQEGLIGLGKSFEVDQGLLVEAALGSKKALAEVTEQVEKMSGGNDLVSGLLLDPLNDAYDAAVKGKGDFKAVAKELDAVTEAASAASTDGKALTNVLADIGGKTDDARKKLEETRQATKDTALSFIDFTKGLDNNKLSFTEWMKGLDEMAKAQRNWQKNMIQASVMGASPETLNKFKEMGSAGAKMLDEMVKGGEKSVNEFNDVVDGAGASADRFGGVLEEVLAGIPTEVLTVFNLSGDKNAIQKAAAVASEYGLTPSEVKTILEATDWATADIKAVLTHMAELDSSSASPNVGVDGVPAAISSINLLQRTINGMNGKTVRVAVQGGTGGGITQNADGGVWSYYANGGLRNANENHIAQIAPAGAMRVWAEPETGGEAYIPLAEAKRPRSRSIAEQTVQILGGTIQWFKDGGINPATKLDIKQAEKQVRDIQRSLDETEKYGKKPKKGKDTRPRRRVLRGLDREVVELQLAEAKRELRDLKNDKAYKTDQAEQAADAAEKARDEAQKIADEAAAEAERVESNRLSVKAGYASNFKIGALSSTAAVDRTLERTLADAGTFLGLLGDLKSKGASPWLLQQLVEAGPTKSAIRLARQYATDSAALARVNATASQIDSLTNSYANLVTNPAFTAPAAWNSGVSSQTVSRTYEINAYSPAEVASEFFRLIRFHEQNQAMEADA